MRGQELYAEVLFRNSGSEAERVLKLLMDGRIPDQICGAWWTPREEAMAEGRSTLRIHFVEDHQMTVDTILGMIMRLSNPAAAPEFVRDALVD